MSDRSLKVCELTELVGWKGGRCPVFPSEFQYYGEVVDLLTPGPFKSPEGSWTPSESRLWGPESWGEKIDGERSAPVSSGTATSSV